MVEKATPVFIKEILCDGPDRFPSQEVYILVGRWDTPFMNPLTRFHWRMWLGLFELLCEAAESSQSNTCKFWHPAGYEEGLTNRFQWTDFTPCVASIKYEQFCDEAELKRVKTMHRLLELDFKEKTMYVFVYLWLCWVFVAVWAFLRCSEWGLLSSRRAGLLTAVASLLGHAGFRACRTWAWKVRAQ